MLEPRLVCVCVCWLGVVIVCVCVYVCVRARVCCVIVCTLLCQVLLASLAPNSVLCPPHTPPRPLVLPLLLLLLLLLPLRRLLLCPCIRACMRAGHFAGGVAAVHLLQSRAAGVSRRQELGVGVERGAGMSVNSGVKVGSRSCSFWGSLKPWNDLTTGAVAETLHPTLTTTHTGHHATLGSGGTLRGRLRRARRGGERLGVRRGDVGARAGRAGGVRDAAAHQHAQRAQVHPGTRPACVCACQHARLLCMRRRRTALRVPEAARVGVCRWRRGCGWRDKARA